MIIFNEGDNDILGNLTLDGERYQLRIGEGKEPDVYHWQGTASGRNNWVRVAGYALTKKIERVRAEWYRAGGTNKKAAS